MTCIYILLLGWLLWHYAREHYGVTQRTKTSVTMTQALNARQTVRALGMGQRACSYDITHLRKRPKDR